MKTFTHVMINGTGAVALQLAGIFSSGEAVLFFIGGLVFDLDHILYHVITEKNLSIRDFLRIHLPLERTMTPKFYVFHTFEFMLAFLYAAFYNNGLIPLFLGFMLHMLCDAIKYVITYRLDFTWAKHWSFLWNVKKSLDD